MVAAAAQPSLRYCYADRVWQAVEGPEPVKPTAVQNRMTVGSLTPAASARPVMLSPTAAAGSLRITAATSCSELRSS